MGVRAGCAVRRTVVNLNPNLRCRVDICGCGGRPVPRPLSAVAHPARTPAHTCEVGGGAGGARAGGGRLALLGRYAAEEEDVLLR